jgi:hypothetical protein
MTSGNFLTALQNLTKWLGYLVLPTLAGLCVIIAIYNYSERKESGRYVIAALLCLMGPACALLISFFVTSPAPSAGVDVVSGGLMNGINWLGNVILPVFAVINVVRGVQEFVAIGEPRFHTKMDIVRHFGAAFFCLMVSGILRLLEHFVSTATRLSPSTPTSLLIHASGGLHIWLCA